MVTRTLSILAATAAACGLVTATTAAPATARTTTETLACGDGYADLDHRDYDYTFASEKAALLAGPHAECAVLEWADPGQRTDYHCYVLSGSSTYTYLRNVSTGSHGWVNDEQLTDGGSDYHC